jgi:hypothetical protein
MRFLWTPLLVLSRAIGSSAAGQSMAHGLCNISRTDRTTDCAPASGGLVVTTPGDLDGIRQCSKFIGNISITNGAFPDFNLDGIQAIHGDLLIADSAALTSISSTTLEAVATLSFKNLTAVTSINLPALNNITMLHLEAMPKLQDCAIATGRMVHDVYAVVVLNVALPTLDWLTWPVARTMTIAANPHLTRFTLPFSRISPGSSYAFSVNQALGDLDLSALTAIDGSLEINGNLDSNLTLQHLESINGYARLSGNFKNITMPALKEINGALRAEASGDGDIISFCNWLSIKPQLLGHYDCTGNSTNPAPKTQTTAPITQTTVPTTAIPSPSVATSSDDQDPSSSTGLSPRVKIGVAVAVLLAALISSAATFWFFRRYTKSKLRAMKEENDSKRMSTSTNDYELDGGDARVEIGPAVVRHELPEPETREELPGESLKELHAGPVSEKKKESRHEERQQVYELPA